MSSLLLPVRSGAARRRPLVVGSVLAVTGLLVVVAGTFLPWLTSGGVDRNSYAVLGIVRRLRFVDGGPVAAAISLWPLIGTVAMLPVIAGILRRWRTAAAATLVFGLLTGVGAVLVLAVAVGHRAAGISLSPTGPVVTVSGAALALAGATTVLCAVRRSRRTESFDLNSALHVSAEPLDDPSRRTSHGADSPPARRTPHSPQETGISTAAVDTERENAR